MSTPSQLGYTYRRPANLTAEPPLTSGEVSDLQRRIASKVLECDASLSAVTTPCHVWQGCRRFRSEAYGAIKFRGRVWRVHRLVMSIELKRWLTNREVVLHLCNNPACVNPDHLQVGSQGQNIQQSYDDDRRCDIHRLTPEEVARIHTLAAQGMSPWDIAEELFLPRSTVRDCIDRSSHEPHP